MTNNNYPEIPEKLEIPEMPELPELPAIPDDLGKVVQHFKERISDNFDSRALNRAMDASGVSPVIDKQVRLQETLKPVLEQYAIAQESLCQVNPDLFAVVKDIAPKLAGATIGNVCSQSVGELAEKLANYKYKFEGSYINALNNLSETAASSITDSIKALVSNAVQLQIQTVSSTISAWLQNVHFAPLTNVLEKIQISSFGYNYKEVNNAYLSAMFNAKWFPYAGWIADFTMAEAVLDILNTSRATENRVKRIDQLLFSYYNKKEIDNIKRGWRQLSLPPYMVRILVQSIQAYHRREYALTVSALATLWEGIIQDKTNDRDFRTSKKTCNNLNKLIEENEYDSIFGSFCQEFIFYTCVRKEDVKKDVPGRHGIAHGWYSTYPNRKVALNAILFTDFLIRLEPL